MPNRILTLWPAYCALSAQLGLADAVSHRARHRPSASDFFQAQSQYAFVRYGYGEAVEAKGKDGSWVKCTVMSRAPSPNSYHVHVLDAAGGYSLPSVPSQMLRRMLGPGERDFYVDNSLLNHSGSGVKYRNGKRLEAKMDDYAPWGTLVSGTDEHDGWVRLGLLESVYLPTTIQGLRVLVPAGRAGPPPPSPGEIAARRAARLEGRAAPAEAGVNLLVPGAPLRPAEASEYSPGDRVQFRTKAGDWFSARIAGAGSLPDTYKIVVVAGESSVYPIDNVAPDTLKKEVAVTTPAPALRTQSEPPASCAKGGCIMVTVKTSEGRDFILHTSRKSRVEMLMKMVCNKLKIDWDVCQAQARFTHQDRELSPWAHVDVSGLDNDAVISMEVLPSEQQPVDDLLLSSKTE